MKYVLVVMYLFTGPDGGLEKAAFTTDFPSRLACLNAVEETEALVLSRVEARALSLECRPVTMWDEPVSMSQLIEYVGED